MSEARVAERKVKLFCEGSDDRELVLALQKGGLVSSAFEPDKEPASDLVALQRAVAHLSVGKSAVALIDLDDHAVESRVAWAHAELKKVIPDVSVCAVDASVWGVATFDVVNANGPARFVLVLAGDPQITRLGDVELSTHTIDDHILRLLLDEHVYAACGEFARACAHPTFRALATVLLPKVLAEQSLPMRSSKKVSRTLYIATDYRGNAANVSARLVSEALKAKLEDSVRACLAPLLRRLERALVLVAE